MKHLKLFGPVTAASFLSLLSWQVQALTFTSSITNINETVTTTGGEVYNGQFDLNALTGYDVSGGQLLIQGLFIRFSYDQYDYLSSQPDTYTLSGHVEPDEWDLNYHIPPVEFEGEEYYIVGEADYIDYYTSDRESAVGTYTIGTERTGSVGFHTNRRRSFDSSSYQVSPSDPNILLATYSFSEYTRPSSYATRGTVVAPADQNGLTDLDGLLDEDDILGFSFFASVGELDLNGVTLSFDYALSPDWVEHAIDDALAPVPVPAAAWLFGSALVGLAGIKGKKYKRNYQFKKD